MMSIIDFEISHDLWRCDQRTEEPMHWKHGHKGRRGDGKNQRTKIL